MTNSLQVIINACYEIYLVICVGILTYAEKFWGIFVSRPLKSLEGEIILITGSANGIGRKIALELVGSKATLICWDNERFSNEQLVAELRSKGTKAFGYTVDISEKLNIKKAAEMVRSDVGDITIIINNAGIAPIGPFLETKENLLEKVFKVNVFAHFWILREFLPKMIDLNHGHVVTIASVTSYLPFEELSVYSSSKHAVVGFIDSLRQEIANHPLKPNIQFTTVCPSICQTKLFDDFNRTPRFAGLMRKFGFDYKLSPDYVARNVVKGFRQNYESIVLPPIFCIGPILVYCLPYRLLNQLKAAGTKRLHPSK